MNEVWKPVVGYEGLYEVSNLGRVKSLNYGNFGYEKIMSIIKSNKFGHGRISLSKGIIKNMIVSRLVALAFIENPNNYPIVCHKDEKLDENGMLYNGVDNLYWGTYKENSDDKWRKGRQNNIFQLNNPQPTKGKFGKNHNSSKPIIQYTKELEIIREWDSASCVERELGYSQGNISMCCVGKKKTAYGFIWRFVPKIHL